MRPLTLVLGGVVLALSLAVTVVLYSRYGGGDLQVGLRGFSVSSESSVTVAFEVDKDPAASVLCTVRARSADGAEVGTALVLVGPADRDRTVVTHELTTTGRAASGEVTGCSRAPTGVAPRP